MPSLSPMIRVLIVDDQRLIREGLRLLLADGSTCAVVGEASDGRAAIAQAAALQPDVVLMDVRMPILDGVAATRAIAAQHPTPRILMLTSDDNDEFVAQALQCGASGYLLKSTPPAELRQAIALVSKGYTQLGPGLGQHLLRQLQQQAGLPQAQPAPPAAWQTLTQREQEIAQLIGGGFNNDEIAQQLCISKSTVKNHVTKILQRLSLRDRTQVAILIHALP